MLPKITEGLIRQHASEQSFCRGEEYYAGGAVISIARRGDVIEAEVEGSRPWPYSVRVEFDKGGIIVASCTCPYDWGGWCKHIVAVLLACIDRPEAIEERPSLESMLDGLDRDQLRRLLLKLVEMQPSLASAVESQVALLQVVSAAASAASPGGPRTRQTALDAAPFRRQVQTILHSLDRMRSSDAYWHVGEVVDGIRQLIDQASAFTGAGDGRSALTILDAVTEEYIAGWEDLDDSDGEASGFFYDLARAWTEAFLTTDLGAAEREARADKLCGWCGELEDYGLDDAFDIALQAVEQGWDFPPLLAALRGELAEGAEAKLEDLDWSGALTSARLVVLERQGRYQEYLNLARAASRMGSYTFLLVKLGRIDEAVEEGLRSLTGAREALALAKELREAGALEGALRVGERGLELGGPLAQLAEWLLDLASGMGKTSLALRASLVAFHETPGLAAYGRVQELAGVRWPEYRSDLLAYLRQTDAPHASGKVDVFLHEGLIADAIAVVEWGAIDGVAERVVVAATESHPDWVIRTCRRRAEAIMDGARAQYYGEAVRWLEHARQAYHASGRQAEWREYWQELLGLHGRKYKLVPMLKALEE